MVDIREYANEAVTAFKAADACPFQLIKQIAGANDLPMKRGDFTAWDVLELLIMVDCQEHKNTDTA